MDSTIKPIRSRGRRVGTVNQVYHMIDDVVYFELKGRAKEGHGLYAIVSMIKWPMVSKFNWYLGQAGYPVCYELSRIPLHKFVFYYTLGQKPPPNLYIDHINRDKLDNRDSNLRLATPQENSFNRSTQGDHLYKGVRKISESNYTASITKDGNKHEIKNIKTESEAAEVYNWMAQELFGEFAALNHVSGSNS
jgi:hypothetical protein